MRLGLSLLLAQVNPSHCCIAHAEWTNQIFVVGKFTSLHRRKHRDQRGDLFTIFGLVGDLAVGTRCGMVDGGLGVGGLPIGVIW